MALSTPCGASVVSKGGAIASSGPSQQLPVPRHHSPPLLLEEGGL